LPCCIVRVARAPLNYTCASMEELKKLQAAILTIAQSNWAQQSQPALLSNLPPLLEAEIPGYKGLLEPRNLKTFIKDTEEVAGYRLVEHPKHRARLGVVPRDVTFEFPSEEVELEQPRVSRKGNDEVVLAFLRALSTLPNAELDKVILPASVLARLLK
jgi:hypothetical protein